MKKNPFSYIVSLSLRALAYCEQDPTKPPPSALSRLLMEIDLVVIGLLASCYAFYPGCLSGDPTFSWKDAIYKPIPRYHDWYPPLVAYTYRLLNQLPFSFIPRHADLFVCMNLLYWTGLVQAIRPWFHNKLLWIIAFLVIGFFPPSFGILSQPIKDSLMCSSLLAAYGSLLTAQRQGSKTALGFALFFLFLAMGYRYNAVFAAFPLTLWAGRIACQNISKCTWVKKIAAGIAIFITLIASISTTNNLLTDTSSYPIQAIYSYDLVGISAITGHIYLPSLYDDYDKPFNIPWTPKGKTIHQSPLTMDNILKLYSPLSNLFVYFDGKGKGLRLLQEADDVRILRNTWLDTILKEPLAYFKVRTSLFLTLLGVLPNHYWHYFCMAGDIYDIRDMGMGNRQLPQFFETIKGTWLFNGISYLSVIMVLLAIAYRKKHIFPARTMILGASAVIYIMSLFLINVAADFRYIYWLMPVSLIMTIDMLFTVITRKQMIAEQ